MADALGRPIAFHLTGGEAADCKAYNALIGLPERAPDAFLADKGYDADTIRADLAERKIEPVIPGRSNRRVKIEYDRALYKQRNRIECQSACKRDPLSARKRDPLFKMAQG